LIAARFLNTEQGRIYNATIELLAIALFRDRLPSRVWTREAHATREHFRCIAEGREPLDGPLP
jgi:hypothetical protein